MSQANRQPCNPLAPLRTTVASIEYELDTVSLRYLSVTKLKSYERSLLHVFKEIRGISKAVAMQCMRSRDAVLNSMRQALDQLGLAIFQLEQKDDKGINSQFHKHLRSCRAHLEEALRYWPS